MQKIQYCRCKINLAGQNCHTVILDELNAVTWPETQVLMQLHGEENVMDVVPVGIGETYPSQEKNRLIELYGLRVVESCFPGRTFRMEYMMTADEDLPRYENGKPVAVEYTPEQPIDMTHSLEALASDVVSPPIFKPGRNKAQPDTAGGCVMLNVTLIELRRELRAETGSSLNPAQGTQVQPTLDLILARQQRELWDAYNWQHLKIYADVQVMDGQVVYSYPVQLKFDQVRGMLIATGVVRDETNAIIGASSWQGLTYGIEPHMIPLGAAVTGVPVRWGNRVSVNTSSADAITDPVGQFELMPAPPSYPPPEIRNDMMIRIAGQAPLSPLINDTDKCIIDSTVIVLFAAAEIMANQKNEAAPMKLQKAQNYLRRLLADQGADKRDNYNMGGSQRGGIDPDKGRRQVPYIDYIP